MKQTFKLFVAIIMVSAFYVIEINADSTVNKELKVLKKEYTQLEKEYNKLIEQGAPSAVIQRKGEELGKLSEVIGKFENGGNTNQTHISNTDISIEDIVLTQNIDAVTDPGTDASSQNNSQPKKSNTNEEISLTVSSDGATKDDALKNALRTAIEQAYGAFVSANTTILNDELVKDEIVTVSNGSIKDYKEVSSFEKPDGSGYMITVNATVSLPHLITYAKNHGSECEFAGNTFGMELKLFSPVAVAVHKAAAEVPAVVGESSLALIVGDVQPPGNDGIAVLILHGLAGGEDLVPGGGRSGNAGLVQQVHVAEQGAAGGQNGQGPHGAVNGVGLPEAGDDLGLDLGGGVILGLHQQVVLHVVGKAADVQDVRLLLGLNAGGDHGVDVVPGDDLDVQVHVLVGRLEILLKLVPPLLGVVAVLGDDDVERHLFVGPAGAAGGQGQGHHQRQQECKCFLHYHFPPHLFPKKRPDAGTGKVPLCRAKFHVSF